MQSDLDSNQLSDRLEQIMRRQRGILRWVMFGVNAGMFVLFTIMAWAFALSAPEGIPNRSPLMAALLLFSIGWGTGVIMNLLSALADSGKMDRQFRLQAAARLMTEDLIERSLTQADKPKRLVTDDDEQVVRLTDDGELTPVERGEATDSQAKRSNE